MERRYQRIATKSYGSGIYHLKTTASTKACRERIVISISLQAHVNFHAVQNTQLEITTTHVSTTTITKKVTTRETYQMNTECFLER